MSKKDERLITERELLFEAWSAGYVACGLGLGVINNPYFSERLQQLACETADHRCPECSSAVPHEAC